MTRTYHPADWIIPDTPARLAELERRLRNQFDPDDLEPTNWIKVAANAVREGGIITMIACLYDCGCEESDNMRYVVAADVESERERIKDRRARLPELPE